MYIYYIYIYMYLHEKTHVCMYILIYRHIKFLCFVPARNPSTPVLSGQILGEVELLETQLAWPWRTWWRWPQAQCCNLGNFKKHIVWFRVPCENVHILWVYVKYIYICIYSYICIYIYISFPRPLFLKLDGVLMGWLDYSFTIWQSVSQIPGDAWWTQTQLYRTPQEDWQTWDPRGVPLSICCWPGEVWSQHDAPSNQCRPSLGCS